MNKKQKWILKRHNNFEFIRFIKRKNDTKYFNHEHIEIKNIKQKKKGFMEYECKKILDNQKWIQKGKKWIWVLFFWFFS